MTIAASKLIQHARRRLRQPEEAGSSLGDADILIYVNSAILTVSRDTKFYRRVETYTGDGTNEYPLPAGCLFIEKVTADGVDVQFVTLNDLQPSNNDPVDEINNAEAGAIVRNNSIFFPRLADGATRYLHYVGVPPEVTDKDHGVIDAPPHYLNLFVFRVCADWALELDLTAKASAYEQKYAYEVRRLAGAEAKRQRPGPNVLRAPGIIR